MSKKFYQSKTFGVALLNVAALKFIPGAKEWVAQNPEAYGEALTATMIMLRLLTQKALQWKKCSKQSS